MSLPAYAHKITVTDAHEDTITDSKYFDVEIACPIYSVTINETPTAVPAL